MIYVLRLLDKPDAAALRQRVRPEHKAYLGAVADRIAFAGPLTHDDGVTMVGSLLAIDFDSRDAAQAWLADEPFTRAGLYAGVEIHAFVNLWPQQARVPARRLIMLKHIVMWNVRGDDAATRAQQPCAAEGRVRVAARPRAGPAAPGSRRRREPHRLRLRCGALHRIRFARGAGRLCRASGTPARQARTGGPAQCAPPGRLRRHRHSGTRSDHARRRSPLPPGLPWRASTIRRRHRPCADSVTKASPQRHWELAARLPEGHRRGSAMAGRRAGAVHARARRWPTTAASPNTAAAAAAAT